MNRVLTDPFPLSGVAQAPAEVTAVFSPGWARSARTMTLAAGDAFSLIFAAALAWVLWALPVKSQGGDLYLELIVLLPLFILVYATSGLYPGFGIGAVETLRRLTRSTSMVFLIVAAFSFAAKVPPTYSRVTFFLAWGISLFTVPVIRFVLLGRMKQYAWWPEQAVILGVGKEAERVTRLLEGAHSLGYAPVAKLTNWSTDEGQVGNDFRRRVLALSRRGVRVAIVADEHAVSATGLVEVLQEHFRHVIVIPTGDSLPVEGVVIRNLGGVLGLEFTNELLIRRNMVTKRTLDVFIGSVALTFALPLIVCAAALVKLVSRGGSPFYFQEREGLGGERVKVWKIRSMYPDADIRLADYLATNADAKQEWDERCKLRDDPRILPIVGTFIRRFSLDELPQLFQVVKGQLSLVGPRPFPDYHLGKFDIGFRTLRRRVRPGVTGLWQISSRSDGRMENQQRFDTHYIRNWSVWIDLYILAQTAAAVLTGRGAY